MKNNKEPLNLLAIKKLMKKKQMTNNSKTFPKRMCANKCNTAKKIVKASF